MAWQREGWQRHGISQANLQMLGHHFQQLIRGFLHKGESIGSGETEWAFFPHQRQQRSTNVQNVNLKGHFHLPGVQMHLAEQHLYALQFAPHALCHLPVMKQYITQHYSLQSASTIADSACIEGIYLSR